MAYRAPLSDICFALDHIAGFDFDSKLADSILGEAGKFVSEVIAPLNRAGDHPGAEALLTWDVEEHA